MESQLITTVEFLTKVSTAGEDKDKIEPSNHPETDGATHDQIWVRKPICDASPLDYEAPHN